ncbi:hypothetical protein ACQP3L_37990, partial [Escherichia coli]
PYEFNHSQKLFFCLENFQDSEILWVLVYRNLKIIGLVDSSCECYSQNSSLAKWWWYMPLILALRRQMQVDRREFKARLAYKV